MTAAASAAARKLAAHIARLEASIEQLDRRVNNIVREARVLAVDPQRKLAKVEAHGLASFWAPWLERANPDGGIRTWSPPASGERVLFLSPTGEPGKGLILRGGYSNKAAAPHDRLAEDLLAVGNARLLVKDEEIRLQVADSAMIIVKGDRIEISVGDKRLVVSGTEIVTYGETRLDDGECAVATECGLSPTVKARA